MDCWWPVTKVLELLREAYPVMVIFFVFLNGLISVRNARRIQRAGKIRRIFLGLERAE